MVKVITYGTYDMLHYGHIRLLERAKALGDYLIVGVTSDDYDRARGKINNQQSLIERMEALRSTGLADEIIVEEYEGQKIDDIRKRNIDIFTIGSDWVGKFDYLNKYCRVIYLPRTEGISSTALRTKRRKVRIGLIGIASFRYKFIKEAQFVDGVEMIGVFPADDGPNEDAYHVPCASSYEVLLERVDAVYVISKPESHYADVKAALLAGKHVLCEAPLAFGKMAYEELEQIAKSRKLILMSAIKTAYATAYQRLVLLAKSGKVGEIVSVDSVCTSMRENMMQSNMKMNKSWNSMCAWAPTALLPIFQILGANYTKKVITTKFLNRQDNIDAFTKVDFTYSNAVASIKVAKAAKAEGELVVSGTKGYIYVPAPWWKTDYFEIRYEDMENNQRFFYQLDGEGIRYEIAAFVRSIEMDKDMSAISPETTKAISKVIDDFNRHVDMLEI